MPPELPPVSREAYQLALDNAASYKAMLYGVTGALVSALVVLFLRLQGFGEKCVAALINNTEALKDLKEGLNRGKE